MSANGLAFNRFRGFGFALKLWFWLRTVLI